MRLKRCGLSAEKRKSSRRLTMGKAGSARSEQESALGGCGLKAAHANVPKRPSGGLLDGGAAEVMWRAELAGCTGCHMAERVRKGPVPTDCRLTVQK